jgi:hypothetical protein
MPGLRAFGNLASPTGHPRDEQDDQRDDQRREHVVPKVVTYAGRRVCRLVPAVLPARHPRGRGAQMGWSLTLLSVPLLRFPARERLASW